VADGGIRLSNSFAAVRLLLAAMMAATVVWLQAGISDWNQSRMALQQFQAVMLASEDLLALVKDAETGQRSYLLTGDARYLEPYRHARGNLGAAVAKLLSAGRGVVDPASIDKIAHTADLTLSELSETVDLDTGGRRADALAIVQSGRGMAYMAELRRQIAEVRNSAQVRVTAAADGERRRAALLAAAGDLLTLLGAGALIVVTVMRLRQHRRTEAELNAAVASRTVELERWRGELATALAAARQALAKAEAANDMKARFMAAASHDLRQPVQSLVLFSELLDKAARRTVTPELVGGIIHAVEALRLLLDGMLDVARLDAGLIEVEARPVPLRELLQPLEAEYAPRAAARGLTFKVVPTRAWIDSDPVLVTRMLRNLVENALKYTLSGGILVGCRRRGADVVVQICDTGIGIPKDRLKDIFEEYVQVGNPERDRAKGLGLGLSIVERLAALLGHRIEVRSAAGRGSTFALVMKRHEAAALAAGTAAAMAEAASHCDRGRVVLIDDDRAVLASLETALAAAGWEVTTAESADEALMADAEAPDVIVADYRLRDGRTGIEAISAVRAAHGQALPAVILTGDTAPERLREAEGTACTLLHKPVTIATLTKAMAEAQGAQAALP
jgi:two-component system, sensor histidine kinase